MKGKTKGKGMEERRYSELGGGGGGGGGRFRDMRTGENREAREIHKLWKG